MLVKGQEHLYRSNLPAPQRLVDHCVAREPESFFPRYCLGTIQNMTHAFAAAALTFDLALERAPHSVAALVKKAVALYPYRQMEAAFAALDVAQRLDPDNPFQWQIRGRAWSRVLQWSDALAAFEQSLVFESSSASGWFDKGKALYHLHLYTDALVAIDRSLALLESSGGWDLRAAALIQLDCFADAIEAYERGLTLHPGDTYMLKKKGLLLAEMKQAEAAVQAFDALLSATSDEDLWQKPGAWYFRGLQLFTLGRFSEALAAFDASLESVPYEDANDVIRVRRRDAQTILNEGDGEILRYKALALAMLRRYTETLPIYDALIGRIPIDGDLWHRKGLALFVAGRIDEARQALAYALVLTPQDTDIAHMLAAMQEAHITSDETVLRAKVRTELTTPYAHSRKLQREIKRMLQIPYLPDLIRSGADESMEDIEGHGYGFAYLQIDKIVRFDDIPAFVELARRLSTVPGVRLTQDQRKPYEVAEARARALIDLRRPGDTRGL
jgi:tetratricopeptide (TPR) repeat protein